MDVNQPPARMRILIIRFGSTGDILLTTPLIRAISQQIDGAEIHYLVHQKHQDAIIGNPYIRKIHVFKSSGSNIMDELQSENFDYVLDLQHNRRSKNICRQLGVPCSFVKRYPFRKWVFLRLKLNTLPHQHVVDRYFNAAEALGIHKDDQGLEYHIPADGDFDTDSLPVFFEDGYVAIIIDAAHATQRIPTNKVVEIATILHKPVALIGGKNVDSIGQEIEAQLGDRAFNTCGKLSFSQTASLLSQSSCVITGDTDLMHLAVALHKPVCTLWGSTVPEFGYYPYMPEERSMFRMFEICSLKCRPCAKTGFKKCPHRHFRCMNKISAVEVAEWINQF